MLDKAKGNAEPEQERSNVQRKTLKTRHSKIFEDKKEGFNNLPIPSVYHSAWNTDSFQKNTFIYLLETIC